MAVVIKWMKTPKILINSMYLVVIINYTSP